MVWLIECSSGGTHPGETRRADPPNLIGTCLPRRADRCKRGARTSVVAGQDDDAGFRQGVDHQAVATIAVGAELPCAFVVDPGGAIGEIDRDRLLDLDPLLRRY